MSIFLRTQSSMCPWPLGRYDAIERRRRESKRVKEHRRPHSGTPHSALKMGKIVQYVDEFFH